MNIVLLESLGVPEEVLNTCAKPLVDAGHTFKAYPKNTDPKVQIERAKDADVIMIANMPLSGEVISACPNGLKVLGAGNLTKKLTVQAAAFSESAKEKIEQAGGKAEVV